MRKISSAIGQIWFPLLLSIMPFVGFFLENRQRQGFEQERLRFFWRQSASRMIEDIRSNVTFADQLSKMGYGFRMKILASISPSGEISPEKVVSAYHGCFPKSHCPQNSTLYYFSINQKKLSPLSHPELGKRSLRILGGLFEHFLEPDGIPEREKSALNKRCSGLFGADLNLAQMSVYKRGKPTPGEFNGKDSYIFWDFIEDQGKKVGVFLLILPYSASLTANPVEFAVSQSRRSKQNLLPVLVPLEAAASTTLPVFSRGFQPSQRLMTLIHEAEVPGRREKISPRGVMSENIDKLWIQRDYLVSNLPYEVWILSRAYSAKATGKKQSMIVVTIFGVALFWLFFVTRVVYIRKPVSISMRIRVLSFFLFLATVSLGSMYLFGSFYIETATFRQIQEQVSQYSEKIKDADNDVTTVFNNFSRAAGELLANPKWCRSFFHGSNEQQLECFQDSIKHFASMEPSILLDRISLYRFGNPDKVFFRQKEDEYLGKLGLLFYQPVAYGGGALFHPELGSGSFVPETDPDSRLNSSTGFNRVLNSGAYSAFNQFRRRTDIFVGANTTFLGFYDYWAEKGLLRGLITFVSRTSLNFRRYLSIAVSQLAFESSRNGPNSDPVSFVFGELKRRNFEPLSEKNRTFWKTSSGRTFRAVLNLAARTNSVQSLIKGNFAWVARPCNSINGFMLGAVIPLERIFRDAKNRKEWLGLFVAFLSVPIFILGLATTSWLLVPLSFVEKGLMRVSQGDLSVKVGLNRNDELGDLAGTFDEMIGGIRERKELGLFVPGQLDAKISEENAEVAMEPTRKTGIVLVSDMRDFTTLSEAHPAREIIAMLNHHHHAMSEIVRKNDGFVELFIGDAIVAVFIDKEDNPALTSAIKAAVGMMIEHNEIQETRKKENRFSYQVGIGLSLGELMTGTLGKGGRLEHVVLGKPRTEAERLEIVSKKGTHTKIIFDRAIKESLPENTLQPIEGEQAWELAKLESPV